MCAEEVAVCQGYQQRADMSCDFMQDTKLSRYSDDGPLQAVRDYMKEAGSEWTIDRERELLFTQHAQG